MGFSLPSVVEIAEFHALEAHISLGLALSQNSIGLQLMMERARRWWPAMNPLPEPLPEPVLAFAEAENLFGGACLLYCPAAWCAFMS